MKEYLILSIIAISLLLSGCNKLETENNSTINITEIKDIKTIEKDTDYLCEEITDNMKIDIELPNIQPQLGKIYEVSGRKFDLKNIAQILNIDLTDASYYINERTGIEYFESDEGWEISGGKGNFEYYKSEDMYEVVDTIKMAYEEELKDFSKQNMAELENDESVIFAQRAIEDIYKPKKNESIVIAKAMKISKEKLQEYQERLVKDGVIVGTGKSDMHFVFDNLAYDNTYYLSFGITIDGIKEADQQDKYGFMLADMDTNTSCLTIDMLVEHNRVIFLYICDAFDKNELSENALISVQDAISVLKDKYELEIIPEKQLISEVYLEYVFIDDAKSNDEYEGKLIPYWCFNNTTSQCSDRINAITGDDFQYE